MSGFVVLTSMGVAGLFGAWAGVAVAGVTCGLFGYLLGTD